MFDFPWFFIYLAIMYAFSPKFALFTLFAAVVLIIIAILNQLTTKNSIKKANQLNNKSSKLYLILRTLLPNCRKFIPRQMGD